MATEQSFFYCHACGMKSSFAAITKPTLVSCPTPGCPRTSPTFHLRGTNVPSDIPSVVPATQRSRPHLADVIPINVYDPVFESRLQKKPALWKQHIKERYTEEAYRKKLLKAEGEERTMLISQLSTFAIRVRIRYRSVATHQEIIEKPVRDCLRL